MTRFEVFVIDPPWPKKKGGLRSVRPNQDRLLDYQTMTVEQIFILIKDILRQATTDHVVFMWTIDAFLITCESEMKMLGYKNHARLIWDKLNGVAPAFTVRYSHEYLIWYYKQKLLPIDKRERGKIRTVFAEPARQHSRKPDISYQLIQRWYPQAHKLDVFSREARTGWKQFGNQVDHFQS